MEALYRDFAGKGVRFYFVYKALAHPELHGYVEPYTLKERLAHVREAQRRLRTTIPWLVDPMDNRLKHAFGDQPNSEFVIGPDGVVLVKRAWSDPAALRKDLERLVGPPPTQTRPEQLDLGQVTGTRSEERPEELPRFELPGDLVPVRVVPRLSSEEPFYAKLRVEVQRSVLDRGEGLVYFDLRLDPLYRVHWNNLVGPVRLELLIPEGGPQFESVELVAPQPDEESDSAPREWLVKVTGARTGDRFAVRVHYAACSDEEGWCKLLSQEYSVEVRRDPDAGRVIRRRPTRQPEQGRGEVARRTGEPRYWVLTVSRIDASESGFIGELEEGKQIRVRVLPGTRCLKRGKAVQWSIVAPGQRVAVRGMLRNDELLATHLLVLAE